MATTQQQNGEHVDIPLQRNDSYWRTVFDRYDEDHDGRISISELRNIIESREYEHEIPDPTVRNIMRMADEDNSGYLDFNEFLKMIHHPQLESVFGHLVTRYIQGMIPGRRPHTVTDTIDGSYEEQYSCFPPPVAMIVMSVVQIILFLVDLLETGYYSTKGPIATIFIYNPYKRFEVWRFLTYMFVHVGAFHLIVNLLVQIMLGIPLEMVHKWWRVLIIYILGVIAGSLGTSITDPRVFLAGASGGVYALITAHIATIIMNWGEMDYAIFQLLIFLIITVSDLGTAIYNRYFLNLEQNIGYTAHLCGAVAGLLVGIFVLRNLEVRNWEKKVWWVSLVIFIILMGVAIVWNIAWPSYFPLSQKNFS